MKVVVSGCRHYNRYDFFSKIMDKLLEKFDNIVIIEGGARGVDAMAKRYAGERGYLRIEVMADWKAYGKSAGAIRNERMLEMADHVIAFWDHKSPGTGNMIKIARKANVGLDIVNI